jgi:hypothetical protein
MNAGSSCPLTSRRSRNSRWRTWIGWDVLEHRSAPRRFYPVWRSMSTRHFVHPRWEPHLVRPPRLESRPRRRRRSWIDIPVQGPQYPGARTPSGETFVRGAGSGRADGLVAFAVVRDRRAAGATVRPAGRACGGTVSGPISRASSLGSRVRGSRSNTWGRARRSGLRVSAA